MEITIRPEQKEDYRAVEEITREAFWNLHVPGCNEHLLARNLRNCPAFIPALDFVALAEGSPAGNIMYCGSTVVSPDGRAHGVITFGPVSVLPELQGKGIGNMLIQHSLKTAAAQGYNAVLIYGDPAYYHRFGFQPAKTFDIRTRDGKFMDPLMALELFPGALDGISGRFVEDDVYDVSDEELIAYDKTFPSYIM